MAAEPTPALERDPFETPEEFAARLTAPSWPAGQVELLKAGYELASGRFPLRIVALQDWIQPWLDLRTALRIQLPRDAARALYQQAPIWPLHARLRMTEGRARLEALVLPGPAGDLPVIRERPDTVPAPAAAEQSPYQEPGDGTVLDPRTGLQWMKCAFGQVWNGHTCTGQGRKYRWDDIFRQVRAVNQGGGFAGYRDWRVPSIDELRTLILPNRCPAIDPLAFPETPTDRSFWSASPDAYYPYYAWFVTFYDGTVDGYDKTHAKYVRFVRGGDLTAS